MSVVSSCNVNNIFYNDVAALKITNQLCSCSAMRSVFDSFKDKISIEVSTGNYPNTRVNFFRNQPREVAEIQIPKRLLEQADTLANFAIEIFNIKNRDQLLGLWDQGKRGELDINPYAKAVEKSEFKSRDAALDLSVKCGFLTKDYMQDVNRDLESHLWNKEIECHTDKIRERWIRFHQQAFCQKNPEKKSCQMKLEDVCDYDRMMQMPKKQQQEFLINRLCKMLPQLPQKVKDSYSESIKTCRNKNDL